MNYQYPLEHGNIPPYAGAVKAQNSTRYDGLPDGIHTGGGWIYNNEFYKPLDAKPFANAEGRFDTQEDIALSALENVHSMFVRNWRVEILNNRRWLIRPVCELVPPKDYIGPRGERGILEIETAICRMNNAGWKLNDNISLAYDGDNIFILDLSCAQKMTWKPDIHDEEDWYVRKFWEHGGASRFVTLREKARHPLTYAAWHIKHPHHKWVYGSFYRPVTELIKKFPESTEFIKPDEPANWKNVVPHTWVITKYKLSEDIVRIYELELGYFPWFDVS